MTTQWWIEGGEGDVLISLQFYCDAMTERHVEGHADLASAIAEIKRLRAALSSLTSREAELVEALKRAGRDFADVQFDAPGKFATMALDAELRVRAALSRTGEEKKP